MNTIILIRALVLWAAIWLSIPLMFWCYSIGSGVTEGKIEWWRFALVSILWALVYLLGAIG